MKKLAPISFAILYLCAFSGITGDTVPTKSTPTEQTKANLAGHGLYYGRLNHIGSTAAFDEALKSGMMIALL